MKVLVAFFLSLISSVSLADTLTVLPRPNPPAHVSNPGNLARCASIGFNADGAVYGACRYAYGNCGRYCQPPTYAYIVTWDATGQNPVAGDLCATTKGHMGAQDDGLTYVAPHSAADCSLVWDQPTVVVVDGHTAHYVSAAADGRELVNINNASFLWTP